MAKCLMYLVVVVVAGVVVESVLLQDGNVVSIAFVVS